jgi:hypothetical protein
MAKPATRLGYDDAFTGECERMLVTLLRGLGPWKDSVFLVGGLTPRYLVPDRPPVVPPHAGTLDVDVVIDLQILADTDAYATLEHNLKRLGFERAENDKGQKLSWRWRRRTVLGTTLILEFLADAPEIAGGRVQVLPSEGLVSAINIPHSSIVFDLFQVTEVQGELLDGNGIATERIRHANLVSFTVLKAFAFDQRNERKDAHDLVYCLDYAPGGLDAAEKAFREASAGPHGSVVAQALGILRKRFARDERVEGHRKDGPVAVAKFELGEGEEPSEREARALRQREVSAAIEDLLVRLGH